MIPRLPFSAPQLECATLFFASFAAFGCSGQIELEARESSASGPSTIAATFTPSEVSTGEWCSPLVESGRLLRGNYRVESASVYQGVEVPILGDAASSYSPVDIVALRAGHVAFRVHAPVAPGEKAELRFVSDEGEVLGAWVEAPRDLGAAEFHFRIPREAFAGTVNAEFRIFAEGDCTGVRALRLPEALATATFSTRRVGAPRVVIVPLRFDGDESGRLPDLEPADIVELSKALEATFPVSGVNVSVREPVATKAKDLNQALVEVLGLRDKEARDPGVAYFGFVKIAPTMEEYCGAKCVTGVATSGGKDGSLSAGVAVGYRGFNTETFVHEMGHIFGLRHSPCGAVSNPDTSFPHSDARLGRRGYDPRTDAFIEADGAARDFMSYCDPAWISDYNYQNLIDRIALTNYAFGSAAIDGADEHYDYVLLDGEFDEDEDEELDVELEDAVGAKVNTRGIRMALSEGGRHLVKIEKLGFSPHRARARR